MKRVSWFPKDVDGDRYDANLLMLKKHYAKTIDFFSLWNLVSFALYSVLYKSLTKWIILNNMVNNRSKFMYSYIYTF